MGKKLLYCAGQVDSILIPERVHKIETHAFKACKSIKSVEFAGTKDKWKAIEKSDDWNEDILATTVKCADGEITL